MWTRPLVPVDESELEIDYRIMRNVDAILPEEFPPMPFVLRSAVRTNIVITEKVINFS